mgnify:CR=1 FL=1
MKIKMVLLITLFTIISCSSQDQVSIKVDEFRKEIIYGKVKEYSYFENRAMKGENGEYAPDKGKLTNYCTSGFVTFPYGRAGCKAG